VVHQDDETWLMSKMVFACVKITPKERKENYVETAFEFLPEESEKIYIFLLENAVEFPTRD
jgi:predicted nucleic acid-binding protein